jgi:DNA-repair protein XRCC1
LTESPARKPFGKHRRELDSETEEEEEAVDEDESYKADSDTDFEESDGPQSDGVEESPLGHKQAPKKRRRTGNKDKKAGWFFICEYLICDYLCCGFAEPTPKIRRAAQRVPFKQLLQGVTIVLSGFQNPIRGILRDNATDMGAKYKTDWDQGCTHLM